MNFKEKVLTMSAKDIVMAMVNALTPPTAINIDMWSYGMVRSVVKRKAFKIYKWTIVPEKHENVCFGCAATNTICNIAGKVFDKANIEHGWLRAEFIGTDEDFLSEFECCINELRCGALHSYNKMAASINLARIPEDIAFRFAGHLPVLSDNYTKKELMKYAELADALSN